MAAPSRPANRLNAQKSTGLRPGRQAKASVNATRHGLRSNQIVLPGEDAASFDQMADRHLDGRLEAADRRPPPRRAGRGHARDFLVLLLSVELRSPGRPRPRRRPRPRPRRCIAARMLPSSCCSKDPPGRGVPPSGLPRGGQACSAWNELSRRRRPTIGPTSGHVHCCLVNLLGYGGEADSATRRGGHGLVAAGRVERFRATAFAADAPADEDEVAWPPSSRGSSPQVSEPSYLAETFVAPEAFERGWRRRRAGRLGGRAGVAALKPRVSTAATSGRHAQPAHQAHPDRDRPGRRRRRGRIARKSFPQKRLSHPRPKSRTKPPRPLREAAPAGAEQSHREVAEAVPCAAGAERATASAPTNAEAVPATVTRYPWDWACRPR